MSTDGKFPKALKEALAEGRLIPLKPRLSWRQQECRKVFMSPEAAEWARAVLPTATTDGAVHGALPPLHQLMTVTTRFCAGETFEPPIPHLMRPPDGGIWRLRTADLRLVGWFPTRGYFVLSEIELKANCSRHRDEELLASAKWLRESLCADDPSFTWETIDDCL